MIRYVGYGVVLGYAVLYVASSLYHIELSASLHTWGIMGAILCLSQNDRSLW